jgi:uncharacterized phage-associated protein
MLYSASAIANYFLDLAQADGTTLTPMKIQKLVYFAHGWKLAIDKAPLIDEPVEAWKYGPVIPSLYHTFKIYGGGPITQKAVQFIPESETRFLCTEPTVLPDDTETRSLLNGIWQTYGKFSGVQLSNMTHQPGTPWDLTWKTANGKKSIDIPDSTIADYFGNL